MIKGKMQRVRDSFTDAPREDISKYMEWLRSTAENLSQAVRKMILIMLLLIAAFELVGESPKTQLSIGAFKIASGSIVIIFIPALVSYMFFQVMRDSELLSELQKVFTDAFTIWSPKAEENNLDLWILPSITTFWNWAETKDISYDSPLVKILDLMQGLATATVILGVICFEIQAYYTLYQQRTTNFTLWLTSAIISAFCLVQAIAWFAAVKPND